ncbi:protein PLASTID TRANSCRIPTIONALLY ACTIVE 16, chloroplastic-like [Coffea arabica]|uniref:Protein PLASTID TRANSCRIPTIONALLY ACTIVE 16, chloroplastic-like n=1 Tax=Coffea arabica TaxID=13443 RepID=A0ABM4VAQ1_COFAR|nr:protein PLASTID TRANSCRIPTIONALLY ACTIVE 16, chloroplastic-like isoform X4 [Coffea arabica]
MAPALSSNSFLLNIPASQSRKTVKKQRLTAFAKKAGAGPFSGFQFGKSADDPSSREGQEDISGNSSPFKFNFGKLPDVKSFVPAVNSPASGLSLIRRKDPGTVFVAGATGQAGVRIAQSLLREGFKVRAGVPDLGAAQELALLAAKYKIISNDESRRLNAVASNFNDAEAIAKAIGNASKVVVTIGPGENGPTADVTFSDALQVIQAAQLANVGHVAIIYNGSSFTASTYNVLDGITSFFGNMFARSAPLTIPEFLQKLVETDLRYTLIKTNLTEDYLPESSYNIVVSAEGSAGATDYKVSKSKIASLVAGIFSNTAVAENKVVKVFTDPAAPSKPAEELFTIIPEDGRRKAYAEALAKARKEEEATRATEKSRLAAEAAKMRKEELKKLAKQEAEAASFAEQAQEKAAAAGVSVESLLSKAQGISSGLSWENLSSQLKSAVQQPAEAAKMRKEELKKLAKQEAEAASFAEQAQEKAAASGVSVESLLSKAQGISSGLSWENLSSQLKSAVQQPGEDSKVQVATVRGQGRARNLPAQKAVVKKSASLKSREVPKPKAKQPESKTEVRKVFGGLFQQETIYVDDD